LSHKNFRITPQRKVILQEIQKATDHQTADEIYELVRRHLPRISLGTVYRNLEFLRELGMIQKVALGGTPSLFEGNTKDHYHIRCLSCGRVDDLPIEPQTEAEETVIGVTDYEITGHRLEVVGLCPECSNKPGRQAYKRAENKSLKKKQGVQKRQKGCKY